VVATATARRAFFPRDGERFLQHLDLQRFAAEQAFQLAHALFEIADATGGDDIFVGFDGVRPPWDISCLHLNRRLGETPCSRATAETVMPGCMVCSTRASFCSAP
jgi:hypothetical protein